VSRFIGRSVAWTVVALLAACESTGSGGGIFESVMGQVANEAARTGVGTVTTSAAATTAQQLCTNNTTWGMCQSMTTTMVAGFSTEFVKRMTQSDVKAAAVARDEAIRTGQPQQWSNPETGAKGFVETKPAEPQPPKPTPVKVKKASVAPDAWPVMDAVGEDYVVTGARGANVRSGPGTQYAVVANLSAQEQIRAISRVRGQDWFMVGRGQVGIGYVAGSLIGPLPPQTPAVAPVEVPAAEVEEVQAQVAAECYTTKQKVTLGDGSSEEATVTSCRTPTGWAQV
jgi:uncharacterized protein YgiM (DUF1202 family)